MGQLFSFITPKINLFQYKFMQNWNYDENPKLLCSGDQNEINSISSNTETLDTKANDINKYNDTELPNINININNTVAHNVEINDIISDLNKLDNFIAPETQGIDVSKNIPDIDKYDDFKTPKNNNLIQSELEIPEIEFNNNPNTIESQTTDDNVSKNIFDIDECDDFKPPKNNILIESKLETSEIEFENDSETIESQITDDNLIKYISDEDENSIKIHNIIDSEISEPVHSSQELKLENFNSSVESRALKNCIEKIYYKPEILTCQNSQSSSSDCDFNFDSINDEHNDSTTKMNNVINFFERDSHKEEKHIIEPHKKNNVMKIVGNLGDKISAGLHFHSQKNSSHNRSEKFLIHEEPEKNVMKIAKNIGDKISAGFHFHSHTSNLHDCFEKKSTEDLYLQNLKSKPFRKRRRGTSSKIISPTD